MKAMILAAGLGTRLKPFTENKPKALAEVNGKTLLETAFGYLKSFGVDEVVVNVHHFPDLIESELQAKNGFGCRVQVSDERDAVLETGGGVWKAQHFFKDEFFVVMNVDVLTNLDLAKMIDAAKAKSAIATLAVMDRASSRKLLFDTQMNLAAWKNMQTDEMRYGRDVPGTTAYAFSGIQILHTDIFKHLQRAGKFSLIDAYLELCVHHNIAGYDHTGDIFLDVGKPESLQQAAQLFR